MQPTDFPVSRNEKWYPKGQCIRFMLGVPDDTELVNLSSEYELGDNLIDFSGEGNK